MGNYVTSQRTTSFGQTRRLNLCVLRWLRAHAPFDKIIFPSFVGASDLISPNSFDTLIYLCAGRRRCCTNKACRPRATSSGWPWSCLTNWLIRYGWLVGWLVSWYLCLSVRPFYFAPIVMKTLYFIGQSTHQ